MISVTVNGRLVKLPDAGSVAFVLIECGYRTSGAIVEKNGEPVKSTEFESKNVTDGDRIEVVQLVGGG